MSTVSVNSIENSVLASESMVSRTGEMFKIGDGFKALAYRDRDFSHQMDPLVMVDHYHMEKPTFGAHPHAGMSAVSVIFEDSRGALHNRDSLGNDFDIMPGDLYWLKAGAGVIHDEAPRQSAKIHGLQVFVNLPSKLKTSEPNSLHVKAQDMPSLKGEGYRVRIVLGESNGIKGHASPALPMTILDGYIESNVSFTYQQEGGDNVWITVIAGELSVSVNGQQRNIQEGQAIALSDFQANTRNDVALKNTGSKSAHFALVVGKPLNETYVQKGPFVMSSQADIAQVEADFANGKFGSLA
ncbi:pirin-like C-terminal cupin domain-containing protein [Paraglaciecola sp.]|uniref:pirin family protein n=1 Tax=Paraglaciecola sp. TaxID=1920173 RepID=UPI0032665D63